MGTERHTRPKTPNGPISALIDSCQNRDRERTQAALAHPSHRPCCGYPQRQSFTWNRLFLTLKESLTSLVSTLSEPDAPM